MIWCLVIWSGKKPLFFSYESVPLRCYFISALWFYFNNLLTNTSIWNQMKTISNSSFCFVVWVFFPLSVCPFAFPLFKYFTVFSCWELCDLCWLLWTWICYPLLLVQCGGSPECDKWWCWRCMVSHWVRKIWKTLRRWRPFMLCVNFH